MQMKVIDVQKMDRLKDIYTVVSPIKPSGYPGHFHELS